jgi:hypothetical protein
VLDCDVLRLRNLAGKKGRDKNEDGDPDGLSHGFLLTIISG